MVIRQVANPTLQRFWTDPGRFAVYGTGAAGEAVFRFLASLGPKPVAFIDTYRTGRFHDLPILAPEDAVESNLDWIVTASMHARDMAAQLQSDGWEGPTLDLTVASLPGWSGHFDADLQTRHADEIHRVRGMLEEDESRRVLDAVLAHRRSLDPADLPPPTAQYRHPLIPVERNDVVLDVGAFDGETALAYAEEVGALGHVHAFEPEGENFEALRRALEASAVGARVTPHRLGCWKTSGELNLRTEGCAPSHFHVSETGDTVVRVTSIDDFLGGRTNPRVDWIKLDVEGAEHPILEGAVESLRALRPKLAICIYHRPEDLWELPLLIREIVPGYRLFMRHHSQRLFDTVCYARPPD